MSTDFVFKRIFGCGFAVLFVLTLSLFALYFHSAEKVTFSLRYYYLVKEEWYTEAGALAVYQEGGASYMLNEGGKEYVALSVYSNREDVQSVCNALPQDKEVSVVEKGVDALYFKGIKQKRLAKIYLGGLGCFDACIRALEQCIFMLDNGTEQEVVRVTLQLLNRQLRYMGEENREEFYALSKACFQTEKQLSNICNSVIMARDLRYLLCEMAEENISMAKEFAL